MQCTLEDLFSHILVRDNNNQNQGVKLFSIMSSQNLTSKKKKILYKIHASSYQSSDSF